MSRTRPSHRPSATSGQERWLASAHAKAERLHRRRSYGFHVATPSQLCDTVSALEDIITDQLIRELEGKRDAWADLCAADLGGEG